VLNNLSYAAATTPGSDTISFDLWDQEGRDFTGTIPVLVEHGGGTSETWSGALSSDWDTAGN
jgi:hypothetical protein